MIGYVGCVLDDTGTEKLRRQLMASRDRLFADASIAGEGQLRVVFDALLQPLRFDVRRGEQTTERTQEHADSRHCLLLQRPTGPCSATA